MAILVRWGPSGVVPLDDKKSGLCDVCCCCFCSWNTAIIAAAAAAAAACCGATAAAAVILTPRTKLYTRCYWWDVFRVSQVGRGGGMKVSKHCTRECWWYKQRDGVTTCALMNSGLPYSMMVYTTVRGIYNTLVRSRYYLPYIRVQLHAVSEQQSTSARVPSRISYTHTTYYSAVC